MEFYKNMSRLFFPRYMSLLSLRTSPEAHLDLGTIQYKVITRLRRYMVNIKVFHDCLLFRRNNRPVSFYQESKRLSTTYCWNRMLICYSPTFIETIILNSDGLPNVSSEYGKRVWKLFEFSKSHPKGGGLRIWVKASDTQRSLPGFIFSV